VLVAVVLTTVAAPILLNLVIPRAAAETAVAAETAAVAEAREADAPIDRPG
jgi:hypothetical protein